MTRFNPLEELARVKHTFGEHGGVNMSIEASTTFTVTAAEVMPEIFSGRRTADQDGCFLYGRHFNPTVFTLGREIAAVESMQEGYCCASGMAAISAAILQLCSAGDHIVASNAVYGGTFAFLRDFLPAKAGIHTTFVAPDDLAAMEAAITPRTRLIFAESLSNPTLVVADIAALSKLAHAHEAALVIDNTFCPLMITPALHGADVVVHSLTKFMNGASDIIGGAVCGSAEFVTDLMDLNMGSLMLLGPTMDPRIAFEVSMRLPHLGLRMAEHSRRALELCTRLDKLEVPVVYPGLAQHPQHELFTGMLNEGFGYGGIFSIDAGSTDSANQLMEYLQNHHRFGFMAVSLGYSETLMSCSGSSTSSELSDDEQRAVGISPGLVRISIGYTGSLEQRWGQLHDALRHCGLVTKSG
ncbi:MAG: aminotransferase class I/II-fold pyridoxal phosphate-dependent enzyme [Myxococcales bacterium]|nr:aminotransferase class I/II-fold pyridoxal phosphate-dependent enzyme [Myxococcales bacterium]